MTIADPLTEEFQVNTALVTGEQDDPEIAALPDGGFVIVYEAFDATARQNVVLAQQYDAQGEPVGTPTQVSPLNSGFNHNNPDVSVGEDGSWVVTWNSYAVNFPPTFGTEIYARTYGPDGQPTSGPIIVNGVEAGEQYGQKVTMLSDGDFVVSFNVEASDGMTRGVFAQVFDADGTPKGSKIELAGVDGDFAGTAGTVGYPNGSFGIAWASTTDDAAGDPIDRSSWYQLFDTKGDKKGQPVELFKDVEEARVYDVAGGADGSFVAVGTSVTSTTNVGVQTFDKNGKPTMDAEVIVDPDKQLFEPSVDLLPDGGFIVTYTQADLGFTHEDTYVQRFDADGNAVGAAQVNMTTGTGSFQDDGTVAVLEDGSFAITWEGESPGESQNVFAQVFQSQWYGTDAAEQFVGSETNELFEMGGGADTVKAQAGDDTVKGGAGADTLSGQKGKDNLQGGKKADNLNGGNGKDKLTGGKGNDELTGGEKADKFIFKSAGDGKDTITDFENNMDLIDLKGLDIGFDDLQIKKADNGASTNILYDDLKIHLDGVKKGKIDADDFLF